MLNEEIWNQFSRKYVTDLEKQYYATAQILFDQLNIEQASKVLEVGIGGGEYLKHFILQKSKSCHWYATDFCEVMLQICSQRIKEFHQNPFTQIKHNYLTEQLAPFQENTIEDFGVTFKKADSRDLKQFSSDYFDRYFANQVLNGPEKELIFKEAWRVLKPEGLLGITLFGRKENCKCVTIFKETGIELGMDSTKFPQKDEFDFNDKNLVISQLEKTGFIIQNYFYVSQPVCDEEQQIENLSNSKSVMRVQLDKAGADEEMIKKIQIALKEKVKIMFEKEKSHMMMETFFIIAKKQK